MAQWTPISKHKYLLLLLLLYSCESMLAQHDKILIPLLMPGVQPQENETYLCTAFKTPDDDYINIVGFEAKVDLETIHHVGLFGCVNPGSKQGLVPHKTWSCKDYILSKQDNAEKPCQFPHEIRLIYSWSEGTIPIELPNDVSFTVGKGTGINYIVLQIHYTNVNPFIGGRKDSSGVIVNTSPSWDKRITKAAGIYTLFTGGLLPAHKEVHLEAACKIEEPLEMHPIAFQPHTHRLGKVVAGYKIDRDGNWQLIGKENPQKPKIYYPVQNQSIVIKKGDVLAARCTLYNFLDEDVHVGASKSDEMCDFYLLYYIDGNRSLQMNFCPTYGSPTYFWYLDKNINYIPHYIDVDASSLETVMWKKDDIEEVSENTI